MNTPITYLRRGWATFRAWRARRRLRRSGVSGRVVDVARVLHDPNFKNVFRKEVSRKMDRREPIRTAQEIAELSLFLVRNRFGVDTTDVQLQVTWDPKQGDLDMTAVPHMDAVRRAFGEVA